MCSRESRGTEWITSAERGHAVAMSNCGYMKELGLGTPLDVVEAYAYYKNAAERGCAEALYNLGRLCIFTDTHLKDFEAGLDWLLKAGVAVMARSLT